MLVRLDAASFAEVEAEWSAQCAEYEENFEEYAAPSIEFAKDIVTNKDDANYGVYCMRDTNNTNICLMHGNVARLPRSQGKTLRIVWVLLAPRFDFEDIDSDMFGQITTGLIMDAMELAQESDSQHVKIHLGNVVDKRYFSVVARTLSAAKVVQEASIRGNWLHITM